ncbi:putative membrane protein [Actinobaculum sp. oral taxon 183 str. F0552]|jgi:predicted membrane protein|uniref:EamA family transporter n=1 Tax=Actinobaculum sp. oral taxon 183 TaxID=712888 RepID=UPI0003986C90|nr:EamA family transporter [Actinobaculum sp. oral taxon 183]ERH17543.1 putative membrane protein [Actinobaculum sp. oral taxon 183 str. F0552]
MWLVFALASALLAGLTSILAKCGIRETDSDVATAVRTAVVVVFAWTMVGVAGSFGQIADIDARSLLFLILSGLATGASWLCYFRALQIGDVNKVVPVDKSSTVLTIVLAFAFLGERVSLATAAAAASIGLGTLMMVERKDVADRPEARRGGWLPFAILSAVFASLTALLGKVGIEGVESNLGTAVRCVVVLAMAWLVVLARGKGGLVRASPRGELGFLCLSGLATGGSWLCYFRALQEGPASVVVPVEKLSVLVSIGFAFVVFRERLTRKGFAGLCLVTAGTLAMVAL